MLRLIGGVFSFGALAAIAAMAGVGMVVWMYDRDLPDHASLAAYEPATLSRVYSGEGRLLAEFARERRIFTPIDEIPQLVKDAFISAEDKNFYQHPGIDATGIARAALANLQALRAGDSRLEGGSTITQQVMKNFLLTSDRSIERKIKEAILSIRIEQALSKDRILELYLNEIFLGQNAYGVAAAAQRYFGKTLEELTLAEAAYLAALPQAPSALHPVRQKARAEDRRNYVLRQMFENGKISEIDLLTARMEPLRTLFDGDMEPRVARPSRPDHFSEEVRRQMAARFGAATLTDGGLTIRATVDPGLQEIAGQALRAQLIAFDRAQGGYGGPLTTLAPDLATPERWAEALAATPAVRDVPGWRPAVVLSVGERSAMVGVEDEAEPVSLPFSSVRDWARRRGRDGAMGPRPERPSDVWAVGDVILVEREGDGWLMRQTPEVQGAVMAMEIETGRVLAMQGGFSYDASVFNRATQALRQPGSAFKPFVYAAALERGLTPASVILDAPVVVDTGGGVWKPQNASGRFYGPSPMRIGLELSRNLMTVRLAQEIGMDVVADYAERFDVYRNMPHLLSYALGAGETTLKQMVAAYAMFANGGRRIEPTLVDRVQDRHGRTIWRHEARICGPCAWPYAEGASAPEPAQTGEQVLDPVTAFQIVSMLEGAVTRGTAARAFAGVNATVAGKTGTTNDAKDVWFVGFTPSIAVGCYIGYDEPRGLGARAFGGTLCAPVVAAFIAKAYEDRPKDRFAPPPGVEFVTVNRWSGRPTGGAPGGDAIAEVFRAGWGPSAFAGDIIGAGDFFYDGGDLPATLDGEAPAAPTGEAARRQAPAIGGAFGSPGGLY
jgi:penicillin-binding protein 1A